MAKKNDVNIDESTVSAKEKTSKKRKAEDADVSEEKTEKTVVDESSENGTATKKKKKKKRVKRKDLPPEERKRLLKRDLIITGSVLGAVLLFFIILIIVSAVGTNANFKKAAAMAKVGTRFTQTETPADKTLAERNTLFWDDELNCYTFVTPDDDPSTPEVDESELRILQLTDVHIGAGAFSTKKDAWAIEAVAEVVKKAQPDLVVVTGDVAYPVPFQAGTFNNQKEAEMFATLMDSLGVYWTMTFGNHDTEIYSLYTREEIVERVYTQNKWKYCIFTEGPSNIDGKGNQLINVQKTNGEITQSLYLVDSHSYTDGDYFGIAWKYDKIHDNQVEWYAQCVEKVNETNVARGFTGDVKSLMFFHIPLVQFQTAWDEFVNNGHKNTENVTYYYGVAGEKGEKCYPGKADGKMFDKILELGSTKGVFCGHDHYNNFSIDYKGVRLTYGMSIDYLAYPGIYKKIAQRGGTLITVENTGSFDVAPIAYQSNDMSYMYEYHKQ